MFTTEEGAEPVIEGQRQSVLEDGDALQALLRQAAHRVRAAPAATSFTIQAIFSVLFSSVYRNNVVLPTSSDEFDESKSEERSDPAASKLAHLHPGTQTAW